MQITSAQCRAARGMLNWTQDQLAKNACVSRATIVDFEANGRQPMKNNTRSIADSMFCAGIDFLQEEGTAGVGVRFREPKIEYTRNVRIDRSNHRASIRMRYAGDDFLCVVDLDTIDDYHQENFSSDDQFAKALSDILHIVLAAAERHAPTHIRDGQLIVTYDMLEQG